MPLPADRLTEILDFDFNALGVLVGQPMGVDYHFGLTTLTRAPRALEQVYAPEMPWLLQTDGRGTSFFAPSSQVSDDADLVYLGYIRPDPQRFPDKSSPEIRRGVMADVFQILDVAEHRQTGDVALVFDRERDWESFDDPAGQWSIFIITETVSFHRPTIGS